MRSARAAWAGSLQLGGHNDAIMGSFAHGLYRVLTRDSCEVKKGGKILTSETGRVSLTCCVHQII